MQMMMSILMTLTLVVQAALSDMEPLEEHEVCLQFRSPSGALHRLIWDISGFVTSSGAATKAVLERNLLNGRCGQVIDGSEIYDLLFNDNLSVAYCLTSGADLIFVDDEEDANVLRVKRVPDYLKFRCSKALTVDIQSLEGMFPKGTYKKWRVLAPGWPVECADGELQILFDKGGYSCEDALEEEVVAHLERSSPRAVQMRQEVQEPFVTKLRALATERKRSLEEKTQGNDAKIVVKYMDSRHRLFGVEWDGKDVLDSKNRSIGAFLRYCILLGTSLGYTDEDEVRHYAFASYNLTRKVLRAFLGFDLVCDVRVKPLEEMPLLTASMFRALDLYGWTVSSQMPCSYGPGSLSITFGGMTLKGTPMVRKNCRVWGDLMVFPRSFLWGLESDRLLREKPEGKTWYDSGPHVQSEKLRLAELGKAFVQWKDHTGALYQVFWDIRPCSSRGDSAEKVLIGCFETIFYGQISSADGQRIQDMLETELKRCLLRGSGVDYEFCTERPLRLEQLAQMFPVDERWQWAPIFMGADMPFAAGEVRILFATGGLRCNLHPKPCVPQAALPEKPMGACKKKTFRSSLFSWW